MSANDAIEVDAPIVSVTVLEDRARVVRRAVVSLGPDVEQRVRLQVAPVAPVLVDKTLAARVIGTRHNNANGAKVTDARVHRRLIAETEERGDGAESARDKLVLELRTRKSDGVRMVAAAELLDAEIAGVNRAASWTLADLADDVARGRGLDTKSLEALDPVRSRGRDLARASARAWHDISLFRRATEDLESQLANLDNPSSRRWCGIVADIDNIRGRELTVEFEYVVPAAMWRPSHEAALEDDGDGGKRICFETAACVWQQTGEDWTDADLLFSTERASLGAEPPRLSTDLLRVTKRQDQLVVETREQEIHTLSGSDGQTQIASELPGIDDGGLSVLLRSASRIDVPSDGRVHRLPLSQFTAPTAAELWAHPELSTGVVQHTKASNLGERAILAGPVELISDGGWVGRTAVEFVAPGEEFELSWGADSTLRVSREVELSQDSGRALSSWTSRERSIVVRLSNVGRETRQISVRERVPVSEIEKVKVEIDRKKNTDDAMPDDDGFIVWEMALKAGEQRRLNLSYIIKRHSDVVGDL